MHGNRIYLYADETDMGEIYDMVIAQGGVFVNGGKVETPEVQVLGRDAVVQEAIFFDIVASPLLATLNPKPTNNGRWYVLDEDREPVIAVLRPTSGAGKLYRNDWFFVKDYVDGPYIVKKPDAAIDLTAQVFRWIRRRAVRVSNLDPYSERVGPHAAAEIRAGRAELVH